MKKIFGTILVAMITSVATLVFATKYSGNSITSSNTSLEETPQFHYANYAEANPSPDGSGYTNLEAAAEISSKAVVHIKTEMRARNVQYRNPFGDDFFDQFFGGGNRFYQQQPQQGSGSGVIISKDGYIVTNNHVVDGAEEVTVILNNKKSLKAKVVGKDASTDLAVLKVEEPNLPYLSYGNSDDVKLGQWVLAVGYPLTLETTVTAGIVSAKYRNIGINKNSGSNAPIESFIQTDAAVNPGNSGGALVNAKGELIGINSAIASPTGSYAGYSFAIPSNIVKKVVADMMTYGNVQRAYLGVGYINMKDATPEQVSAYQLDKVDGVYVNQVIEESSAEKAGIKVGDFITKIENKEIKTGPQMLEKIAQYRPGDEINIEYLRNGNKYNTSAKLKNISGNTGIVKKMPFSTEKLGIKVKDLTKEELAGLRVKNGVIITNITPGGLIASQVRLRKSFVIVQVNGQAVKSTNDLDRILASDEDEYEFTGFYPGYSTMLNMFTIKNESN
ncbi:MAG: Do family serine endopeptidase [Bacteroidetes bacterium]|jgi:serine protease Do|nr:Do family serine endopeptidase [Bacteroidota bacterium]MBK6818702.1 Do family serine endopeptidase [Bacteroidota bacterium]MBK7040083.1 Do family serine endopeptidase [Bacteroidota bacterium]MBK7587054.1 Do family serine endopeptidase [Bacteroidota bacterium]MBK8330271.1 Do family serine endopeptidase [Bacteroidota bacterium]